MEQLKTITSRDNQRLNLARAVRDRRETSRIFVEGVRLAEEAIRSGLTVIEYFVSADFGTKSREQALSSRLGELGTNGFVTSPKLMDSISDTKNSQGVVLLCESPPALKTSDIEFSNDGNLPILLFLFEISDPANVGAVLRTAEAAGVQAVLVSRGSTDVFAPRALRAAMGASFRLTIAADLDSGEVVEWAKGKGLIVTGADVKAKTRYTNADWTKPRLLVMGSEAHGIDEDTLKTLDELIHIPMANGVESLNLGVSAGIILFEAKRLREASF